MELCSIMVLLENCLQTCMTYTIAECTVNKLLMIDRRTLRNMLSLMTKYICEISASSWFYYKENCTAHIFVTLWLILRVSEYTVTAH